MTLNACIRFAPIFTFKRMAQGVSAGRDLYQRSSLAFLPGKKSVPLLVDHDDDQEIGRVTELVEWEDADGPWIVAHATVTDPPAWLEQHRTRASFGFNTLQRQEIGDWGRVLQAIVNEVSVLSPTVEPHERGAKVVLLQPSPAIAYLSATDMLVRPAGRVLGLR